MVEDGDKRENCKNEWNLLIYKQLENMNKNSNLEKDAYNIFMHNYAYDMTDPDEGELCLDVFYQYGPLTDQYWSFTPRILVCNIEPYDQREGIIKVDMDFFKTHWMKQISRYNAQTPRYTAKFITGLLKAINSQKVESDDFKKFDENELILSLEKIAYLNFRVNSGKNVSANKNDSVPEQIKVTGGYITKQIELLNPEIIIIAGKESCKIFNTLYKDCNLSFNEIKRWNNKIICSTSHFSRVKYENFKETICEIVKIFNNGLTAI